MTPHRISEHQWWKWLWRKQNWLFEYSIWSQTDNEQTHPFGWEFFFVYWLNIYISTNLVMHAGVHSSLHKSCHHQILYAKFNLKIHYPQLLKMTLGIFKKLISILLEGWWTNLAGKGTFSILISIWWHLFSVQLSRK